MQWHHTVVHSTLLAAGVCFSLLLSGCGSTTSENTATNAMMATMDVETYGDGNTTAHSSLRLAGGGLFSQTYIELLCPDMLVASASSQGGSSVMRQGQDALGKIYYYRGLSGGAGDTFTISLLRDVDKVSAEHSAVIMPDDFSFTSPMANSSHSRTQDLTINWNGAGSGYTTTISAYGSCIAPYSLSLSSDTGIHTIPANALVRTYDPFPDDAIDQSVIDQSNCSLIVELSKSASGVVDPAYGSGSISASNKRRLILSSSYN